MTPISTNTISSATSTLTQLPYQGLHRRLGFFTQTSLQKKSFVVLASVGLGVLLWVLWRRIFPASPTPSAPTVHTLSHREPAVTNRESTQAVPAAPVIPSDILEWVEKNCADMSIKNRDKVGRAIYTIKMLWKENPSDLETFVVKQWAIVGFAGDRFTSPDQKPLKAAVRAYFKEINPTPSPALTRATEADILAWTKTKNFSSELAGEIVAKVQEIENRPEYQKDPKIYIFSLRGSTHDDTESKAIVYLSVRHDVLNPAPHQVSQAPVQSASPVLIRATEAEILAWLNKRGATLSVDQRKAVILKVQEIEHRSEYQTNPQQYILSQRGSSRNHTEIESKAIAFLSLRHQVLRR